MRFKIILPVLFLFLSIMTHAQNKVTVNGYIKDKSNGETLIGATAYIQELALGVSTNEYGFYAISIPPGKYTIEFAYLGFQSTFQKIDLKSDTKVNIELSESGEMIEEVVITAEPEDENVTNVEMSVNKLDVSTIKKMPSLLGEVEIIRSIQLLPGVSTVGEGASGFNVRGGTIDQNLVLLDEAPVFNSSHLFGFFSVFNPDAVKDVKLYKGGIPARYGGRLASILDVRMKEGNNKSFSANGGIGTIFSRLALEGPIVKDKASFIVAGRRSYIDVLAKPFLDEDQQDNGLNFYDLTLKTNFTAGEKDRLFLSGYLGRDNFIFGSQAGFNWGNQTGTLRWNHLFSEKLFSNLTFYYSDYDYEIKFGDDAINRFDWNAGIVNYSAKPEFTWFFNPRNLIKFGGQAIAYKFEPGNAAVISEGQETNVSLENKYAIESALFFENEQDVWENIKLNYGLRWSHFNYTGKGNAYNYLPAAEGEKREPELIGYFDQWESIQTYSNIEPRFSMKYQLNPSSSVKASYNKMVQYIHLVSNTTASTPVDYWAPASNNIRPQKAHQYAVGYFKNLKDNTYEVTTEVYYKTMSELVDYVEGADLILNQFLEGELIEGEGRAYGLEFMVQKTKGKLTGWLSYTLAKTERRVPGINGNEWYPSRFDQTHNLSITAFYEAGKRWSLSANFVYVTGTPNTFPTSTYSFQEYEALHNGLNNRNNIRIPEYHRLDFGATLKGKDRPNKKWNNEWVFSIYNIYSRRNPFSIYFRPGESRPVPAQPQNFEAIRLSVVGNFIPSITWNFKFN